MFRALPPLARRTPLAARSPPPRTVERHGDWRPQCMLVLAGAPFTAAARLSRMRALAASAVPGRAGRYAVSVEEAACALVAGQLVAFPTETVYGLGAHAFDTAAVCRIFEVKGRPRTDPIICHVPTQEAAERLVRLKPHGIALLRRLSERFWPGPLTIVARACPALPDEITSGTGFVGVRCPDHALALELLTAAGVPVAAPSANRFGHVSPTRAEHVMNDLGAHEIYVLRGAEGESCCEVGIESTVVKIDEEASIGAQGCNPTCAQAATLRAPGCHHPRPRRTSSSSSAAAGSPRPSSRAGSPRAARAEARAEARVASASCCTRPPAPPRTTPPRCSPPPPPPPPPRPPHLRWRSTAWPTLRWRSRCARTRAARAAPQPAPPSPLDEAPP